jgi:hypothetical protein
MYSKYSFIVLMSITADAVTSVGVVVLNEGIAQVYILGSLTDLWTMFANISAIMAHLAVPTSLLGSTMTSFFLPSCSTKSALSLSALALTKRLN